MAMGLAVGWSNAAGADPSSDTNKDFNQLILGGLLITLNVLVFSLGLWTMAMTFEKVKRKWEMIRNGCRGRLENTWLWCCCCRLVCSASSTVNNDVDDSTVKDEKNTEEVTSLKEKIEGLETELERGGDKNHVISRLREEVEKLQSELGREREQRARGPTVQNLHDEERQEQPPHATHKQKKEVKMLPKESALQKKLSFRAVGQMKLWGNRAKRRRGKTSARIAVKHKEGQNNNTGKVTNNNNTINTPTTNNDNSLKRGGALFAADSTGRRKAGRNVKSNRLRRHSITSGMIQTRGSALALGRQQTRGRRHSIVGAATSRQASSISASANKKNTIVVPDNTLNNLQRQRRGSLGTVHAEEISRVQEAEQEAWKRKQNEEEQEHARIRAQVKARSSRRSRSRHQLVAQRSSRNTMGDEDENENKSKRGWTKRRGRRSECGSARRADRSAPRSAPSARK